MSSKSPSGKTRKRRRLSEPVVPSSPAKFLSCFNYDHPIAILLSPLRKVQATVLAKNLSACGAVVVPCAEALSSQPNGTTLTVITDDLEKARSRIPRKQVISSISFVSTKWASAVLSAQKLLPLEPFILSRDDTGAYLSKQSERVNETRPVKFGTTKVLPIWCPSNVTPTSDISAKQAYLKMLPSLSCERMTFNDYIYPSPNCEVSTILDKIARKRMLDHFEGSEHDAEMRSRAYSRASAALKCVPFRLSTPEDAVTLDTFGPRVLSVVREYLSKGLVEEVRAMETDVRLKTLEEFTGLYGVGLKRARHFYDVIGITSMQALRQQVKQRPAEFHAGLVKYLSVEEKLVRIERPLVEKFCDQVNQVVNADDDSLQVRLVLCGGFRRGAKSGHDIDLVYCRRYERREDTTSIMSELVERLQRSRLIHSILHESSDRNGWGEIQYNGTSDKGRCASGKYAYTHDIVHCIGELNGDMFRVDFVGVRDWREMGYATIAWSGSTTFQRDLRIAAERKGWTFNEHGIFERDSGERMNFGIEAPNEMDIFQVLHLSYRACYERGA